MKLTTAITIPIALNQQFPLFLLYPSVMKLISGFLLLLPPVLSTQVTITSPFFIRRLLGVLALDSLSPLKVKQIAPYSLPRTLIIFVSEQTTTTTSIEKKKREKTIFSLPGHKYDPSEEIRSTYLSACIIEPLRTFYESLFQQVKWLNFGEHSYYLSCKASIANLWNLLIRMGHYAFAQYF
ncbi:LOW QUALITY PROTEIN: hypothetical protein Cgig2_011303 [Carnegiea gigantea]|uniref:Uncharacterized protein n=1 Tax=Carnegiea gigantea TaxID=171969 RepID=A0A9Q1JRQ5_9CARY|nr:LOW QUALITY PROTEIN: hypothetical protein Cgig2_011303 [Carnegiea gigantea]